MRKKLEDLLEQWKKEKAACLNIDTMNIYNKFIEDLERAIGPF